MKLKITDYQFFNYSFENQIDENKFETITEYSANFTINDDFIIQISGLGNEAHKPSIPNASQNLCGLKGQKFAQANFDPNEIFKTLEKEYSIENNFYFLSEFEI